MNFFNWYFSRGLKSFVIAWKNLLFFWLRFFSVRRLFLTLFSNWKRDVLAGRQEGFHPILWIQDKIVNTVFRFYGACVRAVVIFTGLLIVLFWSLIGGFLILVWIFFPVILVFFFWQFFSGSSFFLVGLIFLIVFAIFILKGFLASLKKDIFEMSLNEISKESWFKRVIQRAGFAGNVDEIDWNDLESLKKVLKKNSLTQKEFNLILNWEIEKEQQKQKRRKFWIWENLIKIKPIGLYWSYGYTLNLNKYAIELSKRDFSDYGELSLFGYSNELEMLKLSLQRKRDNNILLYGDPGVGKQSIVHYLAREIRAGKLGSFLQDKRIFLLNFGDVISNLTNKGFNPEESIQFLFKEAAFAGDIILFVNQVGRYLGTAENNSSINMSAILIEYLKLPSFMMIGTMITQSYKRLTKEGEAILKNFEIIEVKEPSKENVYRILIDKLKNEERKNVIVTFQALREIYDKSGYINNQLPLPERAIDLLMELLIFSKRQGLSKISVDVVDDFITVKTGVKQGRLDKSEQDKLLNLESFIHKRLVGQENAVSQISNVVRKMRAGVNDKNRPVGSFLFMGPTGVGKTETAKALAEVHFGDEKKMIRMDMSEFQNSESISQLIGDQASKKIGILSSQVEQNPFSLILLDEIEKADSDILNLFLQVLDEGFLTDAFGKKISFKNNIIIATSNAGADYLKKLLDSNTSKEEIKKQVTDHIIKKNIFRVEFLNRFDGLIFFDSLDSEQLKKVTNLILKKFADKIYLDKNIKIIYKQSLIDEIINRGYDKIFGARSIKRYISKNIENLVAKKIISQEIQNGSEIILKKEDLK